MGEQNYIVWCQVAKGPGYGVDETLGFTLYHASGANIPTSELAGFGGDKEIEPSGKPFLTKVSYETYEAVTKAPHGGIYHDLVFYPNGEERPMLAREREIPRRFS